MPNFSQPIKHNALAYPAFNFWPDDYMWGKIALRQSLSLKNKHWFQLLAVGSTGKYTSNRSFFIACGDYGNTLLSNFVHCPVVQVNETQGDFINVDDLAVINLFYINCFLGELQKCQHIFSFQSIRSFWPAVIQLWTDICFCFIKRWYQLGLPLKLGMPVLSVICFSWSCIWTIDTGNPHC